jgi:hypothetical protein
MLLGLMFEGRVEQNIDFPPAKIIETPENTVEGTCKDLFIHAREKGVFNKLDGTYIKNDNIEHPQVGVTAYKISFTSTIPTSIKIERGVQKYKWINNERCPHSNQIHDDRSKYEECPSGGLGCFNGRCQGMSKSCKCIITGYDVLTVIKVLMLLLSSLSSFTMNLKLSESKVKIKVWIIRVGHSPCKAATRWTWYQSGYHI